MTEQQFHIGSDSPLLSVDRAQLGLSQQREEISKVWEISVCSPDKDGKSEEQITVLYFNKETKAGIAHTNENSAYDDCPPGAQYLYVLGREREREREIRNISHRLTI